MVSILQVFAKVEKFRKIYPDQKQTKSPSIDVPFRRKKYSKSRFGMKRRIPGESEETVVLETNFLAKFLRFAKFFKLG